MHMISVKFGKLCYWQGIWNLKTLHFNNPSVYHYNLHDKQGSLITGYPWQVK